MFFLVYRVIELGYYKQEGEPHIAGTEETAGWGKGCGISIQECEDCVFVRGEPLQETI